MIASNGSVFHVSLTDAAAIVTSRTYFWVIVFFSAAVALFDAPSFGQELPVLGRFAYWFMDCVVVTAGWLAAFWMFDVLKRRARISLPCFSAALTGAGIALMVGVNYGLGRVFFDLPALGFLTVSGEWLRYFLISIVFELLTVVFLLPLFPQAEFERVVWLGVPEATTGGAAGDDRLSDEPRDAAAEIALAGGKAMPLDGLMFMKSVEHYVEFVYRDRREMERATLRMLVEQIGPQAGLQTHRSYWVSRDTIAGVARKTGNMVLVLEDGTEIPVSRNRRKAAVEWLNARSGRSGG